MNIVTVAGRIGKDAETRTTQGGDSVTGFSVGADSGFGDKKKTLWYDCSIWGKRGTSVAAFLTKGTPVTIVGELNTREYQTRDGKPGFALTVSVDKLTLQGSGRGRDDTKPSGGGKPGYDPDLDDEVPF